MINHTVMFKLIEFDKEEEKRDALTKIKDLLMALNGKIEKLKYIDVQLNHELASPSFDIILITHFESIEDLDSYQVHPEHVDVVGQIKQFFAGRACVDFSF